MSRSIQVSNDLEEAEGYKEDGSLDFKYTQIVADANIPQALAQYSVSLLTSKVPHFCSVSQSPPLRSGKPS